MAFLSAKEEQDLDAALLKVEVLSNIQESKKQRAKGQITSLLSSKRGIATAFSAGLVKELASSQKDTQAKTSKKAKAAKLASRMGLSAWLSGA